MLIVLDVHAASSLLNGSIAHVQLICASFTFHFHHVLLFLAMLAATSTSVALLVALAARGNAGSSAVSIASSWLSS